MLKHLKTEWELVTPPAINVNFYYRCKRALLLHTVTNIMCVYSCYEYLNKSPFKRARNATCLKRAYLLTNVSLKPGRIFWHTDFKLCIEPVSHTLMCSVCSVSFWSWPDVNLIKTLVLKSFWTSGLCSLCQWRSWTLSMGSNSNDNGRWLHVRKASVDGFSVLSLCCSYSRH